jgi:hypothetical protein
MDSKEGYEAITLSKNTDITEMLEARGILDDDIKMVIHHAETTGEKLYKIDSDELLAQLKIGEARFYVKYSSTNNGVYNILTSYYCKSDYIKE